MRIFFSRYFSTYTVVTLQSFLVQVELCASRNLCAYGQMHVWTQGNKSTYKLQHTGTWSAPVRPLQPLVWSPSTVVAPFMSYCASSPTRLNGLACKNIYIPLIFKITYVFHCVSCYCLHGKGKTTIHFRVVCPPSDPIVMCCKSYTSAYQNVVLIGAEVFLLWIVQNL